MPHHREETPPIMQLRGKRDGIVGAKGGRWEARAANKSCLGVCAWGPGEGDESQERTAYP